MNFPRQKMRYTTTHGGDRSEEGWLVLDVRTVFPAQEATLVDTVRQALVEPGNEPQPRGAGTA